MRFKLKEKVLPSGKILVYETGFDKSPIEGKRAWLKALRSGKYKQTKERLRGSRGFCCLGVKRGLEGALWAKRYNEYVDALTGESSCYKGLCGLKSEGELPTKAWIRAKGTPGNSQSPSHRVSSRSSNRC